MSSRLSPQHTHTDTSIYTQGHSAGPSSGDTHGPFRIAATMLASDVVAGVRAIVVCALVTTHVVLVAATATIATTMRALDVLMTDVMPHQ